MGADSVRTSNIRDHSRADQHVHAMMLLKKEHAKSSGASFSQGPIAQALSKLPDLEKSQLRVKFDLAYFIAREKMAFSKYPKLCELEARHGVSLGTSYTNEMRHLIAGGMTSKGDLISKREIHVHQLHQHAPLHQHLVL